MNAAIRGYTGNSEIAPIRSFIRYQQPARCKRTVIEIVTMFAVAGVSLTIAVLSLPKIPGPAIVVTSISLVVGLVTGIIGCTVLWSFALARIYEVDVTDHGVCYDGKKWLWESVHSIRSTRASHGTVWLFVRVRQRGPFRSCMTIPLRIQDRSPAVTIHELQRYLADKGYSIPWSNADWSLGGPP